MKDFDDELFLLMATKNGVVKKTALTEYSRPKQGGIIAIRLKEGDELVDVVIVGPGDDVLLATAAGMTIRFPHTNARKMGRATAGVRGIRLGKDDELVGIVVAHPDRCLLTTCENGYGKQTPFGQGGSVPDISDDDESTDSDSVEGVAHEAEPAGTDSEESDAHTERSGFHYRSQNRGGKGIRDIRTTKRNGKVVAILAVSDDDEVLMVTTGGKIQRLRAGDISVVGRNTQGVRIIRLEGDDKLASMARIPSEIVEETTAPDVVDESTSTIEALKTDPDTSAPKPSPEAESDDEEV